MTVIIIYTLLQSRATHLIFQEWIYIRPQWQSVCMMHLIPQLLIVTLILSGLRLVISETYYIAPEISTHAFNGSSNKTHFRSSYLISETNLLAETV